MKEIILDTNFLMIPGRLKVDIFDELSRILDFPYSICVLEGTIRELRDISVSDEQKGADKAAARLGLSLAEKYDIKIIERSGTNVDDTILDQAVEAGAIVATQDAELRKRLKAKGVPLIVLRQGNHLGMAGWVQR